MRLLRGLKQRLDSLLAPAVDPRQTPLGMLLDRYQSALEVVRESLEDVDAARVALQQRVQQLDPWLDTLEERAREELLQGREEAARDSLQRRRAVATELGQLETQTADITKEHDRLVVVEQQLLERLDSFTTRENAIRARYAVAEVQSRVNQTLAEATMDLDALELPLAEIEERAEWLRARAQALDELSRGTWEDDPTRGLVGDMELEADLELLRTDVEAERGRP